MNLRLPPAVGGCALSAKAHNSCLEGENVKIFKNLLMSVAVCSMLIACVACSGGNDHGLNPGSPTPVSIWHYYNGALGSTFDEMVTDFNNTLGKEKGIVVSAKSKGSIAGVEEAIRASIDGGRRFRKGRGDQNVPHREIVGGFGDQQDRLG